MNSGDRTDASKNDGYVSLINPDGSVQTPKWIGTTRDGLELYNPLGSVIKDGVLHVQAGAGIVADSQPESEWEETQNKARAIVRALQLAQQGLRLDSLS